MSKQTLLFPQTNPENPYLFRVIFLHDTDRFSVLLAFALDLMLVAADHFSDLCNADRNGIEVKPVKNNVTLTGSGKRKMHENDMFK